MPGIEVRSESRKWALLIGIDQYENATPLRFARADVKALARVLEETCGFAPDRIKLLTDTAGAREHVTHTGIIGALEDMANVVQEGDTFLFYFAGHGITRDGQSYLLGVNADLTSTRRVQMTSVPMAVLRDALGAIPAGEKALILDACRNDPAAGRADAPNRLDRKMWDGFRDIVVAAASASPRVESTAAVLFACDVGQRSWEWVEKGHSVFNHYLVESIEGAAGAPAGDIEFSAVASYVQARLDEWSRQNRERAQRAIYESKGAARLVLGRRELGPARPGGPGTRLSVELSFWNAIASLGDAELFREYLRRYPNGEFTVIAEARLRVPAPVVPQPPPPQPPPPQPLPPQPPLPQPPLPQPPLPQPPLPQPPLPQPPLPQPPPPHLTTLRMATLRQRAVAYFIDLLVGISLAMLFASAADQDDADAVASIVFCVYFLILNSILECRWRHASLGKITMKLTILSVAGGGLKFRQALGRNVVKLLLMLFLGGVLLFWRPKPGRNLPDVLAGTMVIRYGKES